MSVWAYRSFSLRCFFTMLSLVWASLPAMTSLPSDVKNHLNLSNQNCFVGWALPAMAAFCLARPFSFLASSARLSLRASSACFPFSPISLLC